MKKVKQVHEQLKPFRLISHRDINPPYRHLEN